MVLRSLGDDEDREPKFASKEIQSRHEAQSGARLEGDGVDPGEGVDDYNLGIQRFALLLDAADDVVDIVARVGGVVEPAAQEVFRKDIRLAVARVTAGEFGGSHLEVEVEDRVLAVLARDAFCNLDCKKRFARLLVAEEASDFAFVPHSGLKLLRFSGLNVGGLERRRGCEDVEIFHSNVGLSRLKTNYGAKVQE